MSHLEIVTTALRYFRDTILENVTAAPKYHPRKCHHCSKMSSWKMSSLLQKKSPNIHNCFKMSPMLQDGILKMSSMLIKSPNIHNCSKVSSLLQDVILKNFILENVTTGKCYHYYNRSSLKNLTTSLKYYCSKMSLLTQDVILENAITVPEYVMENVTTAPKY
ncbi:hypothetical protein BgiBS90_033116 [Biomphalaria glabrata]|nr:hypothetical protein BgiBS90_033116 [Biomphalaria glabrata]